MTPDVKTCGYMTKQEIEDCERLMLWALQQIKERGPVFDGAGICANVLEYVQEKPITGKALNFVSIQINHLASSWPKSCFYATGLSVDYSHPVEGRFAYCMIRGSDDVWKNPRRHELLNWMIEKQENQLNDPSH